MSNKRGRPLSDNKREHEYHLRLNNEEWELVQNLIKRGVVVSKVLRASLKNYEEVHPDE